MKSIVYCKTKRGVLDYYVTADGKEYFLFRENFHKTNKDYFMNGVDVRQITDFSRTTSASVKRTLEKLPSYIRYVEKEYDLAVAEKTKKAQARKKKFGNSAPYNRAAYNKAAYEAASDY